MELEELHILRNTYGFDLGGVKPGEVSGKIKFKGGGGASVEVRLRPHHVQQILEVVADSMVETTKELTTHLTREIIEQAGLPSLVAPTTAA